MQPELADGFLGGGEGNAAGAALLPGGSANARDSGIRTILFTDIVGSITLTESVGDEAAMLWLSVHDTIVREALAALGGREVKHMGDGIMASFFSAAAAVKCASRVQHDLSNYREDGRRCPIKVRMGLAAGEPVDHHDDLFGSTVQLAARLCSHAEAEQILVSNVVAELCAGKKLPFQELGEVPLIGFDRPVRIHSVAWVDEIKC